MSGNVGRVMALAGSDDVEQAALMLEVAGAIVAPLAVGSALKAMLEECLAAHYVALGGGQVKTGERLPDWAAAYLTTDSLRSTAAGQMALSLSATALAELSLRRPSLAVLESA